MVNPFLLNPEKRRIAVYPGSFDPIHLGHVNIIERISVLYDQIIVLISKSNQKTSLFSAEERKNMVENSLKHLVNTRVDIHEGLTVNFVKHHNGHVIIRGLRSSVDFDFEINMAHMNNKLFPDIETLSIFTDRNLSYISSRGIKEVAMNGGDLTGLVPEVVIDPLKRRIDQVLKLKI